MIPVKRTLSCGGGERPVADGADHDQHRQHMPEQHVDEETEQLPCRVDHRKDTIRHEGYHGTSKDEGDGLSRPDRLPRTDDRALP